MHSKKDSNVLLESYEAQAYNLTNMQDSNLLASNDDKKAEIRYYRIGGPIYNDVFIKNHIIISILVLHA